MATLAIKGHPKRGKEVIEILKMLGGKGENTYMGNEENWVYTINDRGFIDWKYPCYKYKIYSLEKFLEKFPYKIGDNVSSKYLKNYKIEKMEWEDTNNRVIYKLQGMGWYSVNELQPYKEEDMETITIDDFKANTKEWLIDKLGNMSMNDALQTINNIYNELHRPQYPKTYEECCKAIGCDSRIVLGAMPIRYNILVKLEKLLICRDAYWKIAGEEMRLGKPWEPDWKDDEQFKYIIICRRGCIIRDTYTAKDVILAFPTEEMRDAFYWNFKDLIETCKEFL